MPGRYRTRINITLPPEVISETDAMAKSLNTSRSQVIEIALIQFQNRQLRKIAFAASQAQSKS